MPQLTGMVRIQVGKPHTFYLETQALLISVDGNFHYFGVIKKMDSKKHVTSGILYNMFIVLI